jgi:hypothetical protein
MEMTSLFIANFAQRSSSLSRGLNRRAGLSFGRVKGETALIHIAAPSSMVMKPAQTT